MKSHKLNKQGHVDVGVTLAIVIVLGTIAWLSLKSEGEPVAMWLGWPWWAKLLSVVGPIVLLLIGRKLEESRRWPKA